MDLVIGIVALVAFVVCVKLLFRREDVPPSGGRRGGGNPPGDPLNPERKD